MTVDGLAVHGEHHVANRRHSLIGGVELQRSGGASLVEAHRSVDQLIGRRAEADRVPVDDQGRADVADAAAADHRGDVGDGHQLRRQAVGTRRARRPDPDTDRHRWRRRRCYWASAVIIVRHNGAAAGQLQNQGLRAIGFAALDGFDDRADDDLVEDARDLQHVDGSQLGRISLGRWGGCRWGGCRGG